MCWYLVLLYAIIFCEAQVLTVKKFSSDGFFFAFVIWCFYKVDCSERPGTITVTSGETVCCDIVLDTCVKVDCDTSADADCEVYEYRTCDTVVPDPYSTIDQ